MTVSNELIDRLYYVVGNPSAWTEGFDPAISELIREAVTALLERTSQPVATMHVSNVRDETLFSKGSVPNLMGFTSSPLYPSPPSQGEPVAVKVEIDRLRSECARWIKEFDEKHAMMLRYKSDATDAMALYNQEADDFAKMEASLIRLSDKDRQLLRMIVPFVDQRSREPGDAWNEAAAILWLIIDEAGPVAKPLSPAPSLAVSDDGWYEIHQDAQPMLRDGYTGVALVKPGVWLVRGISHTATALTSALSASHE